MAQAREHQAGVVNIRSDDDLEPDEILGQFSGRDAEKVALIMNVLMISVQSTLYLAFPRMAMTLTKAAWVRCYLLLAVSAEEWMATPPLLKARKPARC